MHFCMMYFYQVIFPSVDENVKTEETENRHKLLLGVKACYSTKNMKSRNIN